MFNHVADLIRGWLVPAKVMVTRMDDENIAFFDFNAVGNHLGGIHIVVAADVAQVNNRCVMHQVVHGQ